ncbi:MAG: DNA translocase FtsK [Bacilli bacterium]|nr:DNA translocase FtsK [Bacilli bacterium]
MGSIIVICIIIFIGAILITDISISDIIYTIKEKFGSKDKDGNGIPDGDDEEDDDGYQEGEIDDLEASKVKISLTNSNDKKGEVENKVYTPTVNTQLYKNYEPPIYHNIDKVLNPIKSAKDKAKENEIEIKKNIPQLEKVLREFEVIAKVREVHVGPSVTQYELEIKSGTKMNKVKGLSSEIALAMAAKDVRIEAPIPGKSTVGIEIPNKVNSAVPFREIIDSFPHEKDSNKLVVALGKDIMGTPRYCEINKTPHLLVAGATGSGKSVCVNCIIGSILMRAKPDEVKMVMIDPKKVEFSGYNGLPHLLMPVVTDPRKASAALQKIVEEMEERYRKFEDAKVRNIEAYNAMLENKNKKMADESKYPLLPYIVVIIDELADLMVVAKKEVEDSIVRITQMARAAGIHLIVATQRPSTDVITGLVKANIPSRISFAVSSQIDSRTILDMGGAEKLLGKGDMLFLPMGESVPQRIQGAFIDDKEVERLVNYCCDGHSAVYDEKFNLDKVSESASSNKNDVDNDDPLYNDAVEFVCKTKKASASLLQRRFKIGYNRAANLIDKMEERGIVGPGQGSKPREVLVELDEE